jgi:lipoprotein signal peptidase
VADDHSVGALKRPAAVGLATFLFVLGFDLLTKAVAVAHDVGDGWLVYNDARPAALLRRAAMSLVAVAVTVLLARLARWRGIGQIWGAWVGCGLLVGGIVGNGVSRFFWSRGVPDFIHAGDRWIWNFADFAIGLGLTGGIASIAIAAGGAYAREWFGRRACARRV